MTTFRGLSHLTRPVSLRSPAPGGSGNHNAACDSLERECRLLRQAQTIARIGSWEWDLETSTVILSDSLLALHGLSRASLAGGSVRALARYIHPEDRTHAARALLGAARSGEPMSVRYRAIRASDGALRWFDGRCEVASVSPSGRPCLLGTITDVSELVESELATRQAHDELARAHSYQQAVITASPDVIHIYDVDTRLISRANQLGTELIGYTAETVEVMSGLALAERVPAEDLRELRAAFDRALTVPDGEVLQLRHRVSHDDGSVRWLSRRLTPFQRDEGGTVRQVLVVSRDVSDVVAVEERLQHAALHDDLTGLPNRRMVQDRVEQAIRRPAPGCRYAVMLCDLDGFKRINDLHGHPVGDRVLLATAKRLIDATRPQDTVARLGGDEFVVLLQVPVEEDCREVAETVARRIEEAIAEPFQFDNRAHTVTVSIGICLVDEASTGESVLSDADSAMYHAKQHGASGHTVFDSALRQGTRERELIEKRLLWALSADAIEVAYQPIVRPGDGSVVSVEALLRLRDDDGGYFDTGQVIAVAEQSALITELDGRVLALACRQAAAWRALPGHEKLTLSLNRSARDVGRPGFYDRIEAELEASGLPPRALSIEITETALLDADSDSLADLFRLSDQGVGVTIDDFGTGYASLRYLTALPISCIKIDRSFTRGLITDRTCRTLVRATVGIAADLGIICVVEGVETAEQQRALPDYERLLIQGYLFGRPQPAEQLFR